MKSRIMLALCALLFSISLGAQGAEVSKKRNRGSP